MKQSFPEGPEGDFTERYRAYQKTRERLHEAENREETIRIPELITATLQQKERIASLALKIYQSCKSIEEFEEKMNVLLTNPATLEDAMRMNTDDPLVGSYLLPLSLTNETIPSATESIRATIENLKIIAEFADIGRKNSEGILLSGTNSWGPFYAVRGGLPRELREAGMDQLKFDEFSDIDFLITIRTVEEMGKVVADYVSAELFDSKELNRFYVFKEMYLSGRADIFSVRTYHGGVEESIHFIPSSKMDQLCKMERVNPREPDEYGIDSFRDFRPNLPGNLARHGSYPTGDLKGLKIASFTPSIQEISYPEKTEPAGYLSETPIGGRATIEGQETYFIGVISFYLLVAPTILVDKENTLSLRIAELRNNIKSIMNGQPVKFIPRQDRMPQNILEEVKKSLL